MDKKSHVFDYSVLDKETDPGLRDQILFYHLSSVLTDTERARLLGLPEGCRIRERAKILAPENLTLGKNVWIGEGAIIDAQGGLDIGDNTQVGLNVMIWSHSSHRQAIKGETGLSRENIEYRSTRIGKNCFIGGPSVIGPGVTIGDGVTISPLSFVNRDVADGEVVSTGRESRKLKKKFDGLVEAFSQLLSIISNQPSVAPKTEIDILIKIIENLKDDK